MKLYEHQKQVVEEALKNKKNYLQVSNIVVGEGLSIVIAELIKRIDKFPVAIVIAKRYISAWRQNFATWEQKKFITKEQADKIFFFTPTLLKDEDTRDFQQIVYVYPGDTVGDFQKAHIIY